MSRRPLISLRHTCAGCGESFASADAFNLHATGMMAPPVGIRKRCRTVVEMHGLGMRRLYSRVWYVPHG